MGKLFEQSLRKEVFDMAEDGSFNSSDDSVVSASSATEAPKKRKTWLWVLGWIFCFPIPLTIMMLKSSRTESLNPKIRIGATVVGWLVFALLCINIMSSLSAKGSMSPPSVTLQVESQDLTKGVAVTVHVKGSSDDGRSVNEDIRATVGGSENIARQIKAGKYVFSIDESKIDNLHSFYKVKNNNQTITYDGKKSASISFVIYKDKEAAKAAKEAEEQAKVAEAKAAEEAARVEAEQKAAEEEAKTAAKAEAERKVAKEAPAKQSNASGGSASSSSSGTSSSSSSGTSSSSSGSSASSSHSGDTVVFVTNTGKRYHRGNCLSLRKSKIEKTLSKAKAGGYTPCRICLPPN